MNSTVSPTRAGKGAGDREDGTVGRGQGVSRGSVARRSSAQPSGTQARTLTGRMARIELALEVFDDFDRFFDHVAQFEVIDPPEQIAELVQALQIITHSPLIGRPVKGGKRELVIGQDSRGSVALYCFVADIDTVFILAVGSQRESGDQRGRRSPAAPQPLHPVPLSELLSSSAMDDARRANGGPGVLAVLALSGDACPPRATGSEFLGNPTSSGPTLER